MSTKTYGSHTRRELGILRSDNPDSNCRDDDILTSGESWREDASFDVFRYFWMLVVSDSIIYKIVNTGLTSGKQLLPSLNNTSLIPSIYLLSYPSSLSFFSSGGITLTHHYLVVSKGPLSSIEGQLINPMYIYGTITPIISPQPHRHAFPHKLKRSQFSSGGGVTMDFDWFIEQIWDIWKNRSRRGLWLIFFPILFRYTKNGRIFRRYFVLADETHFLLLQTQTTHFPFRCHVGITHPDAAWHF